MTFHLAFWNLIISGFGTLCLILITLTSKHKVENSSFSSIEAQFAGLTLLVLTSPLALDVAANLITERMSGFKDGLLIGRVLFVIVTFFFGLQITLQYDIWYVFSNFESNITFSLRCYRIIGYSIINYFISITDTVGESYYQVIFLTSLVNVLTCYNALYPSSYVTDLHLLMILKLFKFIFVIRSNYDFWISRNNRTFNYSHFLYVNMISVAFSCEYAIRILTNIYLSRSTNVINSDALLVPVYSWAIITIILTVIPGWITRQDPESFKDQIMATKTSFQRYIAHEMRSPLNSTYMGIDFCINSIPINSIFSELRNVREVLLEVKKSSQDALVIADDMLIQDKLENGNFSIQKEALNIKNFILDYLSTFQVEIRSKNINFEIINCDVDMTNLLNFQQDEIILQNDESNNDNNSDGDIKNDNNNDDDDATKNLLNKFEENMYTKRLAYVIKRQNSGICSMSNNTLGIFLNQSASSKTLGIVQENSSSKKFEDSFQSLSRQTFENTFQNSKPIKTLGNTSQKSVSCKSVVNILQDSTSPSLSNTNSLITESHDISLSNRIASSQKRTSIQRLFNDFQESTPSEQIINNLQDSTPPSLSNTNSLITESQDISLSNSSDSSQKRTSIQRLFNDFQESTPSEQIINNLQDSTPPSLSSTNTLITESQDISLSNRNDSSQKRTSIQRLFNDFQESTPSEQIINNLQDSTSPSLSNTNRLITESQDISSSNGSDSSQKRTSIQRLFNGFQESTPSEQIINNLQDSTPPSLSSTNTLITESQDISLSNRNDSSQKRTSIQRLCNDFQESTPSEQIINNLQDSTPSSLLNTNSFITEPKDISLSNGSDSSKKRTSIQRLFNDFQESTPSEQIINNLQDSTPPSLLNTKSLITEPKDISSSNGSDSSKKRTSIQRLFNDFQESTPSEQIINNLQDSTPPSLSSTNTLITESQDISLSNRSDSSKKRTSIQRLFNGFQESTPSEQIINNLQDSTPPSLLNTNSFITEPKDISLSNGSDSSKKRTSIQRLFNDFQESTPSEQIINNLQDSTPPSLSSTNTLITESQDISLSNRSDSSKKRTSIQRLFNGFQESTPSEQIINNLQDSTPPSLLNTNSFITEPKDISLSNGSDSSKKRTSIQRLFNDFQESTPSEQIINNLQDSTPPSLLNTKSLITEPKDISLSNSSDSSKKRTSIQRLFNDFQENISGKHILNDIPAIGSTEHKKYSSYEKFHFLNLNETEFIESITSPIHQNTPDSDIFTKSDNEVDITNKGSNPIPLSARRDSLGISNTNINLVSQPDREYDHAVYEKDVYVHLNCQSPPPRRRSSTRQNLQSASNETNTNPIPLSARKSSFNSPGLRRLSKQMSFRRLSCKPNHGYEFVDDNDIIFVDKSRFGQVLRNLMSNAIKFTPDEGSIKLCIRFEPDANTTSTDLSRKGMLVFEIKDSGPGISSENQTHLFNDIIQFDPNKLQASGGGSGLGLWISKKIVDMHNGRLTVHSEGEGKGTTFRLEIPMIRNKEINNNNNNNILSTQISTTSLGSRRSSYFSDTMDNISDFCTESDNLPISIPLAYRHRFDMDKPVVCVQAFQSNIVQIITEPTNLSQVNLMPNNKISTSNSSKKKFLLVDDLPSCRKMLRKLLEQRGHICDEAEDGIDAVNSVKATANININAYDAILMDYIMKNMHGPDATRAIRNLGYKGPIIGVTGNVLDQDQEIFMNAGATDVIIKPLKIPRLKEIITDI